MYQPPHFRLEDRDELFAVIRDNPLGILVSAGAGGLMANPLPFLLARNEAGADVLRVHLARANPQWQALRDGAEALVIFQGGEHYVTPAWYQTKKETGKVVPTWNYVHVQVRGRVSVHDDPAFIGAQIAALTDEHEGRRAEPWAVTDAPEAFIAAQMRGIVGVEIAIDAVAGKYKLSQNRQEADFEGVIAGLAAEDDASGPAMSGFTRERAGKLRPGGRS